MMATIMTTQTMNQTLMEVLNTTIIEGQHNTTNTKNNQNQLIRIRELLLNGADVNYIGIVNNMETNSFKKWTPLAYACHHGHLQIAKLLLQHGANINGTQIGENPSLIPSHTLTDAPLYCAVMNGHLELVEFLLQQPNINVNIVNSFKETPLYAACMYGSIDAAIIERLLQKEDCNVDPVNRFGETPLFAACRRGYIWLVRLLLKYGANINQVKQNDGMTPLYIAVLHEHDTIVKLLLLHKNYNLIVKGKITVNKFFSSKSVTTSATDIDLFGILRRNTFYVDHRQSHHFQKMQQQWHQ